MSHAEWHIWYAQQRENYIEQMVVLGAVNRADAVTRVDQYQATLLPDGPGTPSHHFFIAEVAGNRVGMLWLMERGERDGSVAWIVNVETEQPARRRGYGRAIMLLAEKVARNLGHRRMALHVFAKNEAAIALYASLGYRIAEVDYTGQLMRKDVPEVTLE